MPPRSRALAVIDLGIAIMQANACRSDRVNSKFVVVKDLDEFLKRLPRMSWQDQFERRLQRTVGD
jgi:hypothetical protein